MKAHKVEVYAASKAQHGKSQREDEFFLTRKVIPTIAVADGAGNAARSARRAIELFAKLHAEAEEIPQSLLEVPTWKKFAWLMDSALFGGPQSTFCACSILDLIDKQQRRKDVAVGVCAGDSRLYLLNGGTGDLINITDGARKTRLGSGAIDPMTFYVELFYGDLLLMLSDGAYTPMSHVELQHVAVSAKVKHLSEVPLAILDRAGKYGGLADDATAVVLRYV